MNKEEIKRLIEEKKLVEGYINLETQLTPNGFDLTAGKIFSFDSGGRLDFSNSQRSLPECKEITAAKLPGEKFGWWKLCRGAYKVRTNETVNLPNDVIAFAFTRTSLLRMGVFTQNGAWDAGFRGKGEFILVVENPFGTELKENCRLIQLVFFKIKETAAYKGIYKNLE